MKNPTGSTSTYLLHLMLEFKNCKGIFAPEQAATFLALMGECFEECEQLQIAAHPMPIRLCANDNNRDAA